MHPYLQLFQRSAKHGLPLILVIILIVSAALGPLLSSNVAYGKITPSSRPDIEVSVLTSQQEFENEEGEVERELDYMTDNTYDDLERDLDSLPMVFEIIAIPAVEDFLEQHKSELAGKYVDTLFVRYRPNNNEIFVSIWYSLGLYQDMTANELPDQYALKVVDEIQFKIAILKQFPGQDENYQEWVDFNILKYNLMPLASVRVAYLADRIQDLFLQNKETLVKEDATISIPEKEPIIVNSLSAVMFEEMSRLQIHYMDRSLLEYSGRITQYDTGGGQLIPLRSYNSANEPSIKPNTPVIYWKMQNIATTLYATLHTLGDFEGAWLEYPNGSQVPITPVDTKSVKFGNATDYQTQLTVEYEVSLDKIEPPGMYRILIEVPEEDLARAWITAHSMAEEPEEGLNSEQVPTSEQLQECQKLGIDEDSCNEQTILATQRFQPAIEFESVGKTNDIINSFAILGVGAAIAGVIAIVTLLKRK